MPVTFEHFTEPSTARYQSATVSHCKLRQRVDLLTLDNALDNEYAIHLLSGKSFPINFSHFNHTNHETCFILGVFKIKLRVETFDRNQLRRSIGITNSPSAGPPLTTAARKHRPPLPAPHRARPGHRAGPGTRAACDPTTHLCIASTQLDLHSKII